MRRAIISIQQRPATYVEDMTRNANVKLGDFSPCRRR